MHGFKSFGKKTEILFGDNYNCVLGPNGSGKSNVMDALCFVLGKSSAKGLRAEKSSNLIYNGGKSKNPSKEGEVTIYFDNSDGEFPVKEKEVKISRVIKSSGNSKYKVNNKTVTRQQAVDMLAVAKINPDSYNIIMQGDIVRFVEMSPLEKRRIIEEISGISLYEEKKNKALKELEKVDTKLNEAEIILKERHVYLKELKGDRDLAIKYKTLNDKLKQNKASYVNIQITKKQKRYDEFKVREDKGKEEMEKNKASIDEYKTKIEEAKVKLKEIAAEIDEKGDKAQLKIQKDIEQLRVDLETNKTKISSAENEILRIEQRRDQLQKNMSEISSKMDGFRGEKKALGDQKANLAKELDIIIKKIADFKKKHKLDKESEDIENKIVESDKVAEEFLKEIQVLREQQQDLLRKKDKAEFQLQTIDQQISKVSQIEKEYKKEVEALKKKRQDFKNLTGQLNRELDRNSAFAAELGNAEKKLYAAKEEEAKLRIRRDSVKEHTAGNIAIKKIIEQKKRFGGIYGTVADLGNVPSKYAAALEVAAGSKVNSIVVEDDSVAAKCIKYLKETKLGRATFLPLNKMRPASVDPAANQFKGFTGVKGLAVDLISYDAKFKNVFSFVFGSTIIVEDIATARKLGVGKARMATLDGDLTELSGAMHGGFRQRKGTSFRESDVTKGIEKLEEELAGLHNALHALEKQKRESDEEIIALREKKASIEGDIIRTEKSLHLESSDLDANLTYKKELEKEVIETTKDINKVGSEISKMNKGLTNLKIEKQKLRDKISELKNPALLAELNTFEQRKQEITDEIRAIESQSKGFDMQISDILGRDKDNSSKIVEDLDSEEKAYKEEIKRLKEKIKEQLGILKTQEASQKEFYTKFRNLFNDRSKTNEEVSKFESKIAILEDRNRQSEKFINNLSLDITAVNLELAGLKEEFAQYEGVELFTRKSEEDLKKEINECERMKENLGNVNLRALEIYDTVEREYNSLVEKKDKLDSEKEDVLSMIDEIEGKKKDLFMKTFVAINDNFVRIFSQLSHKGEAYLELENEKDPFEGGLNVRVKLSGTKFMDIRSLSGGEKTMTALAFIFSIQEYEPASFYVLDEVDAALDKHNSEKFANLIRQYSNKAQYLIISHNDAVISEADNLYGVSMNEHGISKIVSLKI